MGAISGRQIRIAVLLTVSLLAWITYMVFGVSLRATHFLTGWALFFVILGLALFNVRKKLPFIPLGSATTWTEVHIYSGIFSGVLFALHTGFDRIPRGVIEIVISILFLSVFFSGVLGLFISRVFPARMTTHGEIIALDRIPAIRLNLRKELEERIIQFTAETNSRTVADFYLERLSGYFEMQSNFIFHLLHSDRPLHAVMREIDFHRRYVSAREQEILGEIGEYVRLKNNLDHQAALQMTLRSWLFVHIPLTYSLLLMALLHALLSYAFSGSV